MIPRRRPIAIVLTCLGAWAGGCATGIAQDDGVDDVQRFGVTPPTIQKSWSARLLAPVVMRRAPTPRGHPVARLQPVAPLGGDSVVLLVTGVTRDADGRAWVRVLLPKRPNGLQGWAPADVMRFRSTAMRIVVDQSDRALRVYLGRRLIFRTAVAVGTSGTPTPNVVQGAVAEVIPTNDPHGFLGPFVLPLTVHSGTLFSYAGGNGRVAMHGTSSPDLLGRRVSHGCVRMSNAGVNRLVRLVRPGVPVMIRN
jgi:L,D-transpeptidase catalytic domain